MKITKDNYYSAEANRAYFTASQIKTFFQCPAQWLAGILGLWTRPESPALFHGKYVDQALTEPETFQQFCIDNADSIYQRNGSKYAEIQKLDKAIARVKRDKLFMHYMTGETQLIIALDDFFGHPYKCMLDVLNFDGCFLTDLKTTRALDGEEWKRISDGSFVKVHWISFWKYPMQLGLYREAVFKAFGFRPHPYIAAIEKIGANPEQAVNFEIFDLLDPMPLAGEVARAVDAMDEMSTLKDKDPDEVRSCGHCDWCVSRKVLTAPVKFEYDPRMLQF